MTGGLPTGLWLEIKLRDLTAKAISYYVIQGGNHDSGLVMLKLNGLNGHCKLITQQRNFLTDEMEWLNALDQDEIEEEKADSFIKRSAERDPDLWIVEIEGRDMQNPFEEID